MKWRYAVVCLLTALVFGGAAVDVEVGATDEKYEVLGFLDEHAERHADLAMQLWDLAELGYMETRSSKLLQQQLKSSGFEVVSGVAGIPTAFVASYGEGTPVIGILAEFDALPGISQAAMPIRKIIEDKPNPNITDKRNLTANDDFFDKKLRNCKIPVKL